MHLIMCARRFVPKPEGIECVVIGDYPHHQTGRFDDAAHSAVN